MTTNPANPRLYYRTQATQLGASYPDPSSDITTFMTNMPAAQVLEFEDDTFFIEVIKRVRQQNITYDPKSNPDGNHEISTQYNGMLGKELIISIVGNAVGQSAKWNKLEQFMYRLQKEQSQHKNGSVGLYYPPFPNFSLDPTGSMGYYYDNDETLHQSRNKEIGTMIVKLKFGGTKVART